MNPRYRQANAIAMSDTSRKYPVVLCIAGSDNTGGAGIAADIKACAACGAYAATVITAVTAQNHKGLLSLQYVGDTMLHDQLSATLECMHPSAVKIGLVPEVRAAEIIHEFIRLYGLSNVVVDPVLSATSGGAFTGTPENEERQTIESIRSLLFGIATVVTPNLPELYRLAALPDDSSAEACALSLMKKYPMESLLVKGGHSEGNVCSDILYHRLQNGEISKSTYSASRIESRHTHGTGCTLSSSIAAGLSYGLSVEEAVESAKQTISSAICNGRDFPVTENYGPVHAIAPGR